MCVGALQSLPGATKETPDSEWQKSLSTAEFKVLRHKGTEPRGGEYDHFYPKPEEGYFACKGCGTALYSAESKVCCLLSSACWHPRSQAPPADVARSPRLAVQIRLRLACL